MAVDPRQVLAGFLTITMFLMLANMIKRDHFDSPSSTNQGYSSYCLFIVHLGCTFCIRKYREDRKLNPAFRELRVQNGQLRFRSTLLANGGTVSFCHGEGGGPVREYDETKRTIIVTKTSKSNHGPWLKNSPKDLKPCWTLPASGENRKTEGFVTFSLTNGPEYHVSQIADAVVVARYLGATLVLPDIRGSTPGDKRKFGDVYDVDKFIKNLKGVVKVSKKQQKISPKDIAVVKVPNRVTEDHISEQIDPIYSEKGNIRLATYFPSVNMKKNEKSSGDSVACLAMFGTLELQTEVREVVDSMIERLRTLSRKSDGKFVAVDLRVEMLEKKGCQTTGTKSCYGPEEIALFLKRMGYNKDTTIYLTQSRWDISLDSLKDFFPKTYTKESIMPMDKKEMYLNSETSEFEKVIDFYICTESDSFVPAISGLFYANVAGKRISSGKTQILVPANVPGSASAQNFISPYVSKKNHLAYSCFC